MPPPPPTPPLPLLVLVLLVLLVPLVPVTSLQPISVSCEECTCSSQAGIYHLVCRFNKTQSVELSGASGDALNFTARTFYMNVEGAGELSVRPAFLALLRRYESVAVDLWYIGRLSFPQHFRPSALFRFIGLGIANCSLDSLPLGVVSHSETIGLRLTNVTLGTLERDAFAHVNRVRYVQVLGGSVGRLRGPQVGLLHLSHRQQIHHGSLGLQLSGCRVGVIESGAVKVTMAGSDELVSISSCSVDEIGRSGITVSGAGNFTIANTSFSFLNTLSMEVAVRGAVSLADSRVSAAAPLPLAGVRGGNSTRLVNVTFSGTPPAAHLVTLYRPSGQETLSQLTFACRPGEGAGVKWEDVIRDRDSVMDGEREYLRRAEDAVRCLDSGGGTNVALQPPPPSAEAEFAAGSAGAAQTLFGSGARLAAELGILTAVVAAAAAAVWAGRRCSRAAATDVPYARSLSEPADAEEA